jgi:thiamine-phosphate pyrophosphorylase
MQSQQPILCYVTDSRTLEGGVVALPGVMRAALRAGVDWIQIREKNLAARQLVELAREAVQEARAAEGRARILVNGRLDVALAASADGVQLGGSSLPVAEVREWLQRERGRLEAAPDFLIGRSCHSLAEAQQAEADGGSYVIFGPVFATPSKEQYGPPQGLERLAEVCAAVRIPVLAIGGITVENAPACLQAGAAGVAAIRLFQESPNLAAAVSQIRNAF